MSSHPSICDEIEKLHQRCHRATGSCLPPRDWQLQSHESLIQYYWHLKEEVERLERVEAATDDLQHVVSKGLAAFREASPTHPLAQLDAVTMAARRVADGIVQEQANPALAAYRRRRFCMAPPFACWMSYGTLDRIPSAATIDSELETKYPQCAACRDCAVPCDDERVIWQRGKWEAGQVLTLQQEERAALQGLAEANHPRIEAGFRLYGSPSNDKIGAIVDVFKLFWNRFSDTADMAPESSGRVQAEWMALQQHRFNNFTQKPV